MDKRIRLSAALVITVGSVVLLRTPFQTGGDAAGKGGRTVPALGAFFNPFEGFWQQAEPVGGPRSGSLEMKGLKGNVTIVYDERDVPHIFAEHQEDAFFAQGYVVAGNRLWQMDMSARLTSGRLSEVLGSAMLDNDRLQRRRGLLTGAQKAVEAWTRSPEVLPLLEAYTAGVNAYIDALTPREYPLEFKLLGYAPERWSLLKTALVKKYMDLTLCFGEDDLEATNTLSLLGRMEFDKLFPAYPQAQSPVIPSGTQWSFRPVQPAGDTVIAPSLGLIRQELPEKDRTLVGSNNWAVAGTKTKSGYPILCNDPHLRLSLPSIWFESQLQAPGLNAYGVTVPGIPGLLIGFNERTAWGVTNVGQDVLDWVRVEWTDAERTSYRFGDEIRTVRIVTDTFRVKGSSEPVYDTVRWTDFGPVVYTDTNDPWHGLAMRWVGHLSPDSREIGTFIGLNRGGGYEDYMAALRHYEAPAQNFVFADRGGDVAITVNGRFPVKSMEEGRFVTEGSAAGGAWTRWIPREHLPHSHNPVRGFVASANQHSTDPSYPYYYNGQHFDQYRGRFLNRELERMDSITVEDMMALQQSNYSIHAEEGLPVLLTLLDRSRTTGAAADSLLALLEAWDYRFERDDLAPELFVRWWESYYRQVFDELIGWQDSLPVLMPTNQRLVELSRDLPADPIFDLAGTPEPEQARDIATQTFEDLVQAWSTDRASFRGWSDYKGTTIQHLAGIPAFSRQQLPVGGYKEALNAISKQHGPSWRMVVDLGPELRAWGVFPGGQSGNPGSPFYDISVDPWVAGKYYRLVFLATAGDAGFPVRRTLRLNPS